MMKFKKFLAAAVTGVMVLSMGAAAIPVVNVYADTEQKSDYEIDINYTEYRAYISSNSKCDPYVVLEVLKTEDATKPSATYTYEMEEGSNKIQIDLSFLKANKPSYLRVRGSSETAYSEVKTVNAQPTKLKLKYKAGQAKGNSVADIIAAFDGNDKPTTANIGTYEYRPLYSSEVFQSLEYYEPVITEVAGTTLLVRIAADDEAKNENDRHPAGVEVKVKVPAAPKAPKITVDYAKGIIKMKKGSQMKLVYTLSDAENDSPATQADEPTTSKVELENTTVEFYGTTDKTAENPTYVRVTSENVGNFFTVSGENVVVKEGCAFKGAKVADTDTTVTDFNSYVDVTPAAEADFEYNTEAEGSLYASTDNGSNWTQVDGGNVSDYFELNENENGVQGKAGVTFSNAGDGSGANVDASDAVTSHIKFTEAKEADFSLKTDAILFGQNGTDDAERITDENRGTYLKLNNGENGVEAQASVTVYGAKDGADLDETTALSYVRVNGGGNTEVSNAPKTRGWEPVTAEDAKGLSPEDILGKFFTTEAEQRMKASVLGSGFTLLVRTEATGKKAASNVETLVIDGTATPVPITNGISVTVDGKTSTLTWETTAKGYKFHEDGFEYWDTAKNKWVAIKKDKEIKDDKVKSGSVFLEVHLAGVKNDKALPSAKINIEIAKYVDPDAQKEKATQPSVAAGGVVSIGNDPIVTIARDDDGKIAFTVVEGKGGLLEYCIGETAATEASGWTTIAQTTDAVENNAAVKVHVRVKATSEKDASDAAVVEISANTSGSEDSLPAATKPSVLNGVVSVDGTEVVTIARTPATSEDITFVITDENIVLQYLVGEESDTNTWADITNAAKVTDGNAVIIKVRVKATATNAASPAEDVTIGSKE